jgi:hypothetical protein
LKNLAQVCLAAFTLTLTFTTTTAAAAQKEGAPDTALRAAEPTIESGEPRVRLVAPADEAEAVGTLTRGLPVTTISRTFSHDALLPDTTQIAMDVKLIELTPAEQSLIERGTALGRPAITEVRVVVYADRAYVIRDLYLDVDDATVLMGRSTPADLLNVGGNLDSRIATTAVAAPTVNGIQGTYTNYSAGVVNGKVSMGGCGSRWDGGLAVNDVPGPYTWVITGANFGTGRGSVTVAGQSAQVTSWSPTRIEVNPTVPYYWYPMCAIVNVRTATGVVAVSGANIVPAIRTRVFGQCTWFVALTRLNMGMQPSAGAYQGYQAIDGNYVPRRGDQLQWLNQHTAIITDVQGPFTRSGGYTSWTVRIEQYNADCQNNWSSYPQTFEVQNVGGRRVVTSPIRASIRSWYNVPTVYFR